MPDAQTPHWIESRWQLKTAVTIEALQNDLMELGCLGCYQKLPIEGPEPESSELLAYFPDTSAVKTLAKRLKKLESDDAALSVVKRIPQENWATEWKKHFKPFFLTPNIVIKPSWETYTPQGQELIITLDPGMAFGTGQHDTTQFCAALIEELKASHPDLQSLNDIGCGSGILSIIAHKLGFSDVTGLDIETPAIEASKENATANECNETIKFFLTNGKLNQALLKPSDIVVSNIIAETLCELKEDLIRLTKPQGFLVLSGILPERGTMVQEAFADLECYKQQTSKDWHAYVYRR